MSDVGEAAGNAIGGINSLGNALRAQQQMGMQGNQFAQQQALAQARQSSDLATQAQARDVVAQGLLTAQDQAQQAHAQNWARLNPPEAGMDADAAASVAQQRKAAGAMPATNPNNLTVKNPTTQAEADGLGMGNNFTPPTPEQLQLNGGPGTFAMPAQDFDTLHGIEAPPSESDVRSVNPYMLPSSLTDKMYSNYSAKARAEGVNVTRPQMIDALWNNYTAANPMAAQKMSANYFKSLGIAATGTDEKGNLKYERAWGGTDGDFPITPSMVKQAQDLTGYHGENTPAQTAYADMIGDWTPLMNSVVSARQGGATSVSDSALIRHWLLTVNPHQRIGADGSIAEQDMPKSVGSTLRAKFMKVFTKDATLSQPEREDMLKDGYNNLTGAAKSADESTQHFRNTASRYHIDPSMVPGLTVRPPSGAPGSSPENQPAGTGTIRMGTVTPGSMTQGIGAGATKAPKSFATEAEMDADPSVQSGDPVIVGGQRGHKR